MALKAYLLFSVNNISTRLLWRLSSWWTNLQMGPLDPIMGLTELFKEDTNPNKVNLGVGAYRDDNGNPYVLPSVRLAEEKIRSKNMDKEYTSMLGTSEFCKSSITLALGENSQHIANGFNATTQSISGTGGIRIAAAFLKEYFAGPKTVYLSMPTWGPHIPMFQHVGFEIKHYTYLAKGTNQLDFQKTVADINNIPAKSLILLQASAHNPTGVDPTQEQWKELSHLIKRKNIFPIFDMAYQGFASGDCDKDAYPVRLFLSEGHNIVLIQSFSKNMGLYGERAGACSVITDSKETTAKALSQMKIIIRNLYSSPPISGARIVTEILNDAALTAQWKQEVKNMAHRIISMRTALRDSLQKQGSSRNWEHITDQSGMFFYSGMSTEQVEQIVNKYHIYISGEGRISMAGVTTKNVEYLAHAMHSVTK